MESSQINRRIPAAELAGVFGLAIFLLWFAGLWIEGHGLWMQVAIWTIYLLIMLVIWKVPSRENETWKSMGFSISPDFSWSSTFLRSLLVFVLATLAFVAVGLLAPLFGGLPPQADFSGYDFLKGNLPLLILTLIAIYIGSSLGEEVVFRGFLITRLHRLFHGFNANFWSVAVSGLIFGMAHVAWGPLGILQTTAMGWVLGYFYLRYQRNLWVTILAHVYMDTLLILQIGTGG